MNVRTTGREPEKKGGGEGDSNQAQFFQKKETVVALNYKSLEGSAAKVGRSQWGLAGTTVLPRRNLSRGGSSADFKERGERVWRGTLQVLSAKSFLGFGGRSVYQIG